MHQNTKLQYLAKSILYNSQLIQQITNSTNANFIIT